GILLAEDRDQHVGARDLLLAVRGALDMHDRALDHALEAERRLRVDFLGAGDDRGVLLDEAGQVLAQFVDVGGACAQHLSRRGIVEQREQQVLHGDELVALLPGLDKRHMQADFKLLRDHASSITHCSGCWCSREKLLTCSTFVAATSCGYMPQTPRPSRWTFNMTCVARSRSI